MTRPQDRLKRLRLLGAAVALSALAACGGGGGGGGGEPTTYSVGGLAAGLNGPGLVLRNGTESLSVPATGSFTFTTRLAQGASYAVSVVGHPVNQTCSASNASGTVGTANVTNIAVACVAAEPPPPPPPNTYTVGGEVTGLNGTGMVLTNNGVNHLAVTADGAFTFGDPIATGMHYAVAIATQPSGQTCTVANAGGTVGSTNISNVTVHCGEAPPALHTISGTVSNLTATGLILHNNGGDPVTVPPGATSFSFAAKVAHGGSYNVAVATQPGTNLQNSQDCTVGSTGTGTASGDVSNVAVTCGAMGPLRVLGSSPADGATGVSTRPQLGLNFSSPVDPASVTALGVRLDERLTGTTVASTVSVTGSTVRFTPAASLRPFTSYEQRAALLRGLRGETQGPAVARSFTTGDNAWRDVHLLSGGVNAASTDRGQAVALDAAGDAIAAWTSPSDVNAVRLSYYKASRGTWEAGPSLVGAFGGPVQAPKLAMDDAGNALLVWWQELTIGGLRSEVIWAARYSKAGQGSWETPQVISHQDRGSPHVPAVAVRGDGKAAVAWMRNDVGVGSSIYMRSTTTAQGEPWSSSDAAVARMDEGHTGVVIAQPEVAVAIAPVAASGQQPEIAVLWAKPVTANGITYVWSRVVRGDGSRSDPLALSDGSARLEHVPQVAIDDSYAVHAAWRRSATVNGTEVFVFLAKSRDAAGGNWRATVQLNPVADVRGTAQAPILSRDGRWAGWQQLDNVSEALVGNLWVSRIDGTGRQALGASGSYSAGVWPGWLGADRDGNVLAIWSAGNGLVASRYVQSTGTWTLQSGRTGTRVGPYGAPPSGFAINAAGSVLASWVDAGFTGSAGALQVRLFD